MMVALELSPNPHPDAAPTARAMTFLTAPHSSTPSTSVFVYGLKVLVAHRAATRAATASSVAATTVAVGWWAAISSARLGPETTATRSRGRARASPRTWLMRSPVPSSTPFIRETARAVSPSSPRSGDRTSRALWEGTATTTRPAPSTARVRSLVADTPSGRRRPGT